MTHVYNPGLLITPYHVLTVGLVYLNLYNNNKNKSSIDIINNMQTYNNIIKF